MKQYKNLFFMFLATVFLAGCHPVVLLSGTAVGGYLVGKDERTAKIIFKDTSISTEINTRYLADDLVSIFEIDVNTYRGLVTLTGTVSDSQVADRAIEIAQEVEGVLEVNSLLEVK